MRTHYRPRFVFGDMFGPKFIACARGEASPDSLLMEALNEWDERFGERADFSSDAGLEQALNDGEARVNDGGTIVYVDPYEWFREYHDGAALRACFAPEQLRRCKVQVYVP